MECRMNAMLCLLPLEKFLIVNLETKRTAGFGNRWRGDVGDDLKAAMLLTAKMCV